MVAYFIRRTAGGCPVIDLDAGDRETVVQDGLSPIEAEILCATKIADIPPPAPGPDPKPRPRIATKGEARQLALEF
jgi:hypothetical protein